MNEYDWPLEFRKVWDNGLERHKNGTRDPGRMFLPVEQKFLESIGCTSQELFDFVDDCARYGEPDFETVLLITAVRREFFKHVQQGRRGANQISMESLPSKSAAVEGIEWLPRIIEKARAKLKGEMPPELMYGCGGDRPFLRSVNIEPSEFLRVVWAAKDDNQKVVDFVKEQRAKLAPGKSSR